MWKRPLCHMRTAKAQTSMRIRAVWSEHPLFVDIYYKFHWFCKRTTKAQISLRECAGWSGPPLSVICIRTLFVRCISYDNRRPSLDLFHKKRLLQSSAKSERARQECITEKRIIPHTKWYISERYLLLMVNVHLVNLPLLYTGDNFCEFLYVFFDTFMKRSLV